jgi:hypothetical protein
MTLEHGGPLVAVNVADGYEAVTPGDLGDELAAFTRAMRSNDRPYLHQTG